MGLGKAFTQKDVQRNDRILAYGNRTLHTHTRKELSDFRKGLSCGILCSEDISRLNVFSNPHMLLCTEMAEKIGDLATQTLITQKCIFMEKKKQNYKVIYKTQ